MKDVWTHLPLPIQRRFALWFGCRVFRLELETPVISFTFDDFPRSALLKAGAMLRERGLTGTYYASFGLMGKTTATGEIFTREDLNEGLQEHELACHTFDHCDAWKTAPSEFEASILRNQEVAGRLSPGRKLTSLSYPISHPRPRTKRRIEKYFSCARGGGQTFNAGVMDLNYLKAFFIEQSRNDFGAIAQTIDANVRAKGWLIFATHDVCDLPTRFGCTPAFFERVVDYSTKTKTAVLPISKALKLVHRGVG